MRKNLFTRILTVMVCVVAGLGFAAAQVPFDRGMTNEVTFVPKGQWITGVSVSYSAAKYDNYQFFILEGLSGNGYSFKLSPMAMYAFDDNLAAGGRFSYSRSMIKMEEGSLVLATDTQYDIDNLYALTHSYGVTGSFRYYISLGGSNRFGIFTEAQVTASGGQSKLSSGTGSALSGTYQRNFGLSVGLTPGMMMFLSNYSAIEVNVGVLGFNYYNSRSITDQIYVANLREHSANFMINLFSITFGVAFYL